MTNTLNLRGKAKPVKVRKVDTLGRSCQKFINDNYNLSPKEIMAIKFKQNV